MAVRDDIQREMHVLVYTSASDSSYGATQHLVIPTGTWDPTLSFLRVAGSDWLVFDHMESGGTGILQFAMLVVAWDGQRFKPIASESLDYTCARPTSLADYQLNVRHAFSSNGGGLSLRLDYDLIKDEQRLGKWSDTLRWNPALFAFELAETTPPLSDSTVQTVRARITHARESLAINPALFFPDVFGPVCFAWMR